MSVAYYTGIPYNSGTMTYNNIVWTTTNTTTDYDFSYNYTNTLISSSNAILICTIPYTFSTVTNTKYRFSLPLGYYNITIAGGTVMFYTFSVCFFMYYTATGVQSYFAYIPPANTDGSIVPSGSQAQNLNYYINPSTSGASGNGNNLSELSLSTSFLNNSIPYVLVTAGVRNQTGSNAVISIYKTQ